MISTAIVHLPAKSSCRHGEVQGQRPKAVWSGRGQGCAHTERTEAARLGDCALAAAVRWRGVGFVQTCRVLCIDDSADRGAGGVPSLHGSECANTRHDCGEGPLKPTLHSITAFTAQHQRPDEARIPAPPPTRKLFSNSTPRNHYAHPPMSSHPEVYPTIQCSFASACAPYASPAAGVRTYHSIPAHPAHPAAS